MPTKVTLLLVTVVPANLKLVENPGSALRVQLAPAVLHLKFTVSTKSNHEGKGTVPSSQVEAVVHDSVAPSVIKAVHASACTLDLLLLLLNNNNMQQQIQAVSAICAPLLRRLGINSLAFHSQLYSTRDKEQRQTDRQTNRQTRTNRTLTLRCVELRPLHQSQRQEQALIIKKCLHKRATHAYTAK